MQHTPTLRVHVYLCKFSYKTQYVFTWDVYLRKRNANVRQSVFASGTTRVCQRDYTCCQWDYTCAGAQKYAAISCMHVLWCFLLSPF